MNIAILIPEELNGSSFSCWSTLLEELISYDKCNIYLIVANNKSKHYIENEVNSSSINVFNVVTGININTYSENERLNITNIHSDYWLPRAKLQLSSYHGTVFDSKSDFNDIFCSFTFEIMNYLKYNNIESLCLGVWNGYNTPGFSLIESVCNHLKLTTFVAERHGLRLGIYDNSLRRSFNIRRIFQKKIQNGLTDIERNVVLKYCEYNSKNCNALSKRTELEKIAFFSFLKNSIIRYLKTLLNKTNSNYDDFDVNKKYVLFLPNKYNNFRANSLVPFYNNATIVKSIYASLPMGYSLIVKDHPHSYSRGVVDIEMVKAIKSYSNCYYVDPVIDTDVFVQNSEIVFSMATSAVWAPLIRFKHIVVFGDPSIYFDEDFNITKVVSKMELLPSVIRECIGSSPPIHNIMVYLHSFIKTTLNLKGGESVDVKHDINKQRIFYSYGVLINRYINEVGRNNLKNKNNN